LYRFDDLELVYQSLRTLEPPHTHKFPRVNAQDSKLGPHSTLGRERFFKAGPRVTTGVAAHFIHPHGARAEPRNDSGESAGAF
jgi:hypothetical protein